MPFASVLGGFSFYTKQVRTSSTSRNISFVILKLLVMELPKILVSGTFKPEDLIVSVNPSNRKIDPTVEAQIETVWNTKMEKAKEAGKVCYNGVSYRLNSLQEKDNKVVIDFGTFEYKVRDGLIAIPEYFDLPDEYYRKGCFTTATIKTSDDVYLMIELTGKSMNENTIDLVGGIMETDTEMVTGEDVFKSFYKELTEEVGVDEDDIDTVYLSCIYLEHRTNVGFYFEAIVKMRFEELVTRFSDNEDIDVKSILSFSRDEYIQALNKHPSPNKPFIAKLLKI